MNITEHLLTCLIEECSEIQKDATKALRFGLDDKYNTTDDTNRTKLVDELHDLMGVVAILRAENIISLGEDGYFSEQQIHNKVDKIYKFMEYAREHGTLTD